MTAPTEPTVTADIQAHGDKGEIATVTLYHESKLNVLDTPLMDRLLVEMEGLGSRDRLRAVVLTGGGGKAFIGGADIHEMAQLTPASAREFITKLHRVCNALRQCPVPVIARIQGYCVGAGLEVAAACDLRVATEESTFGMPEVRVGIPSVIEACLLPRLIGWGKTRELVFTGDMIDAKDALKWGLVERVVHAPNLDEAVAAWTNALLDSGPRAVRAQKQLVQQWEDLAVDDAIQAGIDCFAEAYESDEPTRLMGAFLARRNHDGASPNPEE